MGGLKKGELGLNCRSFEIIGKPKSCAITLILGEPKMLSLVIGENINWGEVIDGIGCLLEAKAVPILIGLSKDKVVFPKQALLESGFTFFTVIPFNSVGELIEAGILLPEMPVLPLLDSIVGLNRLNSAILKVSVLGYVTEVNLL